MTTQSPHLYERQPRPGGGAPGGKTPMVQTRLPWWAIALPVAAFVTLLALLGSGSADASTAASGTDAFSSFAGLLTALGDLVRHLL